MEANLSCALSILQPDRRLSSIAVIRKQPVNDCVELDISSLLDIYLL